MSSSCSCAAYARTADADVLAMVTTTLDAMAAGGIYDHLGGGFARYSVDGVWLVPHFEKMLYDQALLARVYLHAWQVTGEARYRQVLDETIDYVLRDLRHPDGGFYSAEDADSEGVEGKFYVWTRRRAARRCSATTPPRPSSGTASRRAGNFEGGQHPRTGRCGATWPGPPEVERARQALFDAREKRVRPGLDDKVLTEWNALFLAALAEAAAATGRADWLADAAVERRVPARRRCAATDGRWLRSWQAGRPARHLAYAADHAALVDAFTRLAEATGEARWIAEARTAADALLDLFWDDEARRAVHHRPRRRAAHHPAKDLLDNAIPSANGIAAGRPPPAGAP